MIAYLDFPVIKKGWLVARSILDEAVESANAAIAARTLDGINVETVAYVASGSFNHALRVWYRAASAAGPST